MGGEMSQSRAGVVMARDCAMPCAGVVSVISNKPAPQRSVARPGHPHALPGPGRIGVSPLLARRRAA
jgi:hypothetical protein